jgi:flagellar basal body-associated protein FliL
VTEKPGGTSIFVIIGVLCVLTLVLGGILVAFFILQGRKTGAGGKAPVAEVEMGKPQAEMTDYTALGETPPMVQFMASYKLGDDLFDDSFSIDSHESSRMRSWPETIVSESRRR